MGQKIFLDYRYPAGLLPDAFQDWIGIFPYTNGTNLESLLRAPLVHLRLCGQLSPCEDNHDRTFGSLFFGDPLEDYNEEGLAGSTWNWPLDAGIYQAYLVRGGDGTPVADSLQVLAISDSFEVIQEAYQESTLGTLQAAEADLRVMLRSDPALALPLVRLGFHGCTGSCDGCVDLDNPEHADLEIPIQALEPLVKAYESLDLRVSRADLWTLAASVAAEHDQPYIGAPTDWSLEFVGRINCEDVRKKCLDANGKKRKCGPTTGPFVEFPDADSTPQEVLSWFADEFGLSVHETVVLLSYERRDQDYFHELVGSLSDVTVEELIELADDYQAPNVLWKTDFPTVYKKVLNHGYDEFYQAGKVCPEGICFYDEL